ncbi:hypothetical protein IID20_01940, partial [Patescibacteria group bacterium]|nr:hypothetical protein [Patescibacteria group bacterium]
VDQFTPIVVAIAIIGIIFFIARKSSRRIGIFVFLCFVFTGPFLGFYAPLGIAYPHQTFLAGLLNKYVFAFSVSVNNTSFNALGALERFYVMSFIIFSIFIGLGVFAILQLFKKFKFNSKLILVATVLFFTIPAFPFRDNFEVVNKRNFTLGQDFMDNLFLNVPPNAIFITRGDRPTFAAYYYTQVQKKRQDVTLIGFGWRKWNTERLKEREPDLFTTETEHLLAILRDVIRTNIDKRPIYVTGLPNVELVQLGIGGAPFVVNPRGMILKMSREWDSGTVDYWENMIWQGPKSASAYYDQYAKELIEQYVIGHSNSYYHNRTMGYYDLAYQDMLALLELNPDHYLSKRVAENWEKNKGKKRVAKELVIGDAKIHYDLGTAYFNDKKVTEAMAEFWAAVFIEPDNTTYRSVLAGTYEIMRWYDESLEQYHTILEIAPDNLELREDIESRIKKVNDKFDQQQQIVLKPEYKKIYESLIKSFNRYVTRYNLKKPWQLVE